MWEYEYSAETTPSRDALWRHWSDVLAWPRWNAGIETITIDGPFEAGTTFTMTPPGEDPVKMTLTEVVPGSRFTDLADGGSFQVITEHRLEEAGPLTRIVYRTEITGPDADQIGPEIGPQITADFPDVVAALIKLASG
jgi:hypothetical protein